MLFNSVFTIFWDFNIQCRVCYTACSVNRRETVSLFKFPIKSLMIPFELNWPVSLITIYILYVIITTEYITCFKQNKIKSKLHYTVPINILDLHTFTIYMLIGKKNKKKLCILNLTATIEWLKDALQNQHLVVTASTSRGQLDQPAKLWPLGLTY